MRLSLREEIENYKQSELRKNINKQEIPLKFTIDNIDCYFYNRDLYGLFELNTEKDSIKATDFLPYFKEGFLKGLNYLNEEEEINLSTLRNDLTGGIVKRIKTILYEQEFVPMLSGLLSTTKIVPAIFTEKSIFNAGFYDGIIYKIDELLLKAGIDKEEILNSKPQQYSSIIGSRTKQIIIEKFENFDNKGWNYAFQSENDFILFVDLLTNYFEANSYQLPTNIIQLKKGCKTKTAKILGEIQKVLSQHKLIDDKDFFQIIRVLNHFNKEPEADLYKAFTR